MKAKKVGAAAGESPPTASASPSPQPAATPIVPSPSQTSLSSVQQITEKIAKVEISIPREPCLYQGKLIYHFLNNVLKAKIQVRVVKEGVKYCNLDCHYFQLFNSIINTFLIQVLKVACFS